MKTTAPLMQITQNQAQTISSNCKYSTISFSPAVSVQPAPPTGKKSNSSSCLKCRRSDITTYRQRSYLLPQHWHLCHLQAFTAAVIIDCSLQALKLKQLLICRLVENDINMSTPAGLNCCCYYFTFLYSRWHRLGCLAYSYNDITALCSICNLLKVNE